jgi:hypothetical protein
MGGSIGVHNLETLIWEAQLHKKDEGVCLDSSSRFKFMRTGSVGLLPSGFLSTKLS